MIKVQKLNVVLSIEEEKLEKYLANDFVVVQDKQQAIEQPKQEIKAEIKEVVKTQEKPKQKIKRPLSKNTKR